MKKLLILLAFCLPLISVGQNWSPPGATWYYGFSVWMTEGYYKIEYTGDTTIVSTSCKKLRKTVYSENIPFQMFDTTIAGTEFTYADNDKVYIYKHNQFYTLYDFSAQVGDTWIVPENKHYSGCDSTGTVRVDSIGTMTINAQILRYICVSITDPTQKWGFDSKIVELIGPIKSFHPYTTYDYLFPVKLDYCGMGTDELIEGGQFRCYSDNTFNYSSNIATTCDYMTSVSSLEKKLVQINIYPNPSNGSFTVNFDKTIVEMRLTDLLGNIILQHFPTNQTTLHIDNLPSGSYILRAINGDGGIMTKKIISGQ